MIRFFKDGKFLVCHKQVFFDALFEYEITTIAQGHHNQYSLQTKSSCYSQKYSQEKFFSL